MNRSNSIHQHPQRLAAAGVLFLSVFLLGACGRSQIVDPAQAQTASSAQAKEPKMGSQQSSGATASPAADLDTVLKKGMAYGDFRKLILGQGWKPIANPACKANLVGEGANDLCAKNPQLSACKVCDELPELDSCSSDAHCLMRFRHPDAVGILKVTGYGEVEYWSETGGDAGLKITDWELAESKNE